MNTRKVEYIAKSRKGNPVSCFDSLEAAKAFVTVRALRGVSVVLTKRVTIEREL